MCKMTMDGDVVHSIYQWLRLFQAFHPAHFYILQCEEYEVNYFSKNPERQEINVFFLDVQSRLMWCTMCHSTLLFLSFTVAF